MEPTTTEKAVLKTLVEMKQEHRAFIRTELKKKGLGFSGLLVRYGMVDEDDPTAADEKYHRILNRYLSCENALTGEKGEKIRAALEAEGVDLSASPTYPLGVIDASHDSKAIKAAS